MIKSLFKNRYLPRLRRPRIRVRTLLLGITVLAVCLSVAVNEPHRERRVIVALRARGAWLLVTPDDATWMLLSRWFEGRPLAWILGPLGEGYLTHVDSIHLPPSVEIAKRKSLTRCLPDEPGGPPGNDADLQLIASLAPASRSHWIDLSCTHVTDAGLRHLAQLRNLDRLVLSGTEIDGRGFSHLAGLPNLSWLELDATNFNDAGLQSLARLPLQFLYLRDTRITDASIPYLSGLHLVDLAVDGTAVTGWGFKGFRPGNFYLDLSLAHCPVDDEGLRHVVTVPKLRALNLNRTRITDAGMEYLDRLVRSDDSSCLVHLSYTSITDAGLRRLRGAKGSLCLHAGGTAVTKAGADELTQRLPGYSVRLDCDDCPYCDRAAKNPKKQPSEEFANTP